MRRQDRHHQALDSEEDPMNTSDRLSRTADPQCPSVPVESFEIARPKCSTPYPQRTDARACDRWPFDSASFPAPRNTSNQEIHEPRPGSGSVPETLPKETTNNSRYAP